MKKTSLKNPQNKIVFLQVNTNQISWSKLASHALADAVFLKES